MPASKMADFAKEQLRSLKPWTIESLSLDNGVNAHYMFQASLMILPMPTSSAEQMFSMWNTPTSQTVQIRR